MKKVPVVMIQCVKKIMMKRKILQKMESQVTSAVEEIMKKIIIMTATELVTVMVMMILPLDTGLVSDCSTVLPPPPSMCNVVLSACLPAY